MEVSVIIVSYNSEILLDQCLTSLEAHTKDIRYEIIVVENFHLSKETNPLSEKYAHLNWIYPGYNAGFGRANNLGFEQATGQYILFLNPDTQVEENVVFKLYSIYRQKELEINIGALSCRIINLRDGSLLVGSGKRFQRMTDELLVNPVFIRIQKFFGSKKKRKYNPLVEHQKNHKVDFVSGACLFLAKEKIEQFNLKFDNDFFLYYEDVELCYRIKKQGLQNYFTAETSILHVNSGSTSLVEKMNFQILLSKWLFFRKTTNGINFTFYEWLVKMNTYFNYFLAKRSHQKNTKTLKEEMKISRQFLGLVKKLQFRHSLPYHYLKLPHELD